MPGIVPPQVQYFIFPHVELRKVPVSPFFQLVRVPLDGSTTLCCISLSSQFCITSEFDMAICSVIQIINEDIDQD